MMCGGVSVPVTRSTSVPPKFTGATRLCTSLENELELPPSSGSPPPSARPQKIMIAPARKFSIRSMPSWRILEQSKPGGTSGLIRWALVVMWYLCAVRAKEEAPTLDPDDFAAANSVKANREMPANATNRPIKTRRLKKADWEVDFFFIGGHRVGGFEV